jgi:hypothetical protein
MTSVFHSITEVSIRAYINYGTGQNDKNIDDVLINQIDIVSNRNNNMDLSFHLIKYVVTR